MNKLYLVSSNKKCLSGHGYDTYDSFVVCCKTEDEARRTHPQGSRDWKNLDTWGQSNWVVAKEIPLLDVTYLGVADDKTEEGVILASFNAG